MPTNKLAAVAGEYVADALKILLVWFIGVMSVSGPAFANLTHQGALIALALSAAVWLSTCVSHYLATGQLDPPAPAVATVTATTSYLQPGLVSYAPSTTERETSLQRFDATLRQFLAELDAKFSRHSEPVTPPAPAPLPPSPPAPPSVV